MASCYLKTGVNAAIGDAVWFTTSGGSTPIAAPGASDIAILDANSFTTTGLTFTIDADTTLSGLSMTGLTNAPTITWNKTLTVNGNVTLPAPGTCTLNGSCALPYLIWQPSGHTLTTNGQTFPNTGGSNNASAVLMGSGSGATGTLTDNLDWPMVNVRFPGILLDVTACTSIEVRTWQDSISTAQVTITYSPDHDTDLIVRDNMGIGHLADSGASTYVNSDRVNLVSEPIIDFVVLVARDELDLTFKSIHAYPGIGPSLGTRAFTSQGGFGTPSLILEAGGVYNMQQQATTWAVGALTVANGSSSLRAEMFGAWTSTAQIRANDLYLHDTTHTGSTPAIAGRNTVFGANVVGWSRIGSSRISSAPKIPSIANER